MVVKTVWLTVVLSSILYGLAAGRGADMEQAILAAGKHSIELTLTLTGAMALWNGVLAVLDATGDVARLGRGLRRLLAPLFPGLTDPESWAAMGTNLAANMAGLGNAATPAGIRAARLLVAQGETGLRALAMLLALNNSSLQLIPTTVIALRAEAGAAHPADVWPAALVSSGAATLTAALLMGVLQQRRPAWTKLQA